MKIPRAIAAGIMISIGGAVNLAVGGTVGAVMFAVGLCGCLALGAELITGRIAYIEKRADIRNMVIMYLGNIVGTFACGLLYLLCAGAPGQSARLDKSWYVLLAGGLLCGALIYIAVEGWKQGRELVTVLAVAAFILGGGEHCIADAFYLAAAGFPKGSAAVILLATAGNFAGALILRKLTYKKPAENKDPTA